MKDRRAFALVELLVVICGIGILAAVLLPAVSYTKGQARSAVCKNNLSQVGRALAMYVSDFNIYPSAMGGGGPPFKTWADQLAPYDPLVWTNHAWNCPSYLAEGGIVQWQPPPSGGGAFKASTSYSYNATGMRGIGFSGTVGFVKGPALGLGNLNLTVRDNHVVAPGEMYAVGDARPMFFQGSGGFVGHEVMDPWKLLPSVLGGGYTEGNPPHNGGYNLLFADAHVALVKRENYLYPPRAAKHWNRDNQVHQELWSATNEWVVQN